jgi:hypothetical protein
MTQSQSSNARRISGCIFILVGTVAIAIGAFVIISRLPPSPALAVSWGFWRSAPGSPFWPWERASAAGMSDRAMNEERAWYAYFQP